MTNEKAKKMLKAKLECLKRETSGIDCNDGYNCDECNLCYEQGNMGEQKEALKMAIKALEQTEWIPIKTRPMTEEEREHFFEYVDRRCDDTYTILDCPLPDDGQEVIISVNGYVSTDIFCRDSADGCYFESYDIDDVDAWMPLPEPYKEDDNGE